MADVFDLGSLFSGGLGNLSSLFGGGATDPNAAAAAPAGDTTGTAGATPSLGFTGGTIGANRNALIGLGLGMLGGSPWNRFGPALQGYEQGAGIDASTLGRAQQLQLQTREQTFREQQAKVAQQQWQQQFAFNTMSDAKRAAQDLGIKPDSPQGHEFMTTYYRQKLGDQPTWGIVAYDDFKNPIMGWISPANKTATAVSIPGQTTTAGAVGTAPAASAFTGGVPYVGPSGAPTAAQPDVTNAASPGAPPAGTGSGKFVAGPNGTQIEIPKGADPVLFRQNVSRALADAAVGKTTEQQSKDAQYASRMAIASQSLNQLENQGTNLKGNVLAKVPFLGNYAQTPQYQEYQNAKSQFVTALLRKESGAAIAQHEFDRYDRELFPQPGDAANVVEQKRQLRDAALANMARAAGPSYQAPAVTPRQTPIGGGQAAPESTSTRQGGAAVPASRDAIRQELIRRGINPPQ